MGCHCRHIVNTGINEQERGHGAANTDDQEARYAPKENFHDNFQMVLPRPYLAIRSLHVNEKHLTLLLNFSTLQSKQMYKTYFRYAL